MNLMCEVNIMEHALQQYKNLTEFLSLALGDLYETGLFDLKNPALPLIAASKEQSDVHEEIRKFICEEACNTKKPIAGRPLVMELGKMLKVSVFYIQDEKGEAVAALWLSMRCDFFLKLGAFANAMMPICEDSATEENARLPETVTSENLEATILTMAEEFATEPARLSLNERQELILDLYEAGTFNIKGSVAKVAEILQVSEQSVYRYISKIKKNRDW